MKRLFRSDQRTPCRPDGWGSVALVGLALVGLLMTGCGTLQSSNWVWNKPKQNGLAVETPAMRMVKLRDLQREARDKPVEEQEQIAGTLARDLPKEVDPLIRAQMVRTLAAYPSGVAAAAISQTLQDPDHRVRIAACEALGERGGSEAIEGLGLALASDSNIDVRLAAARGLGSTKDKGAVDALAVALDDPDPALQHRAVRSLEQVTGRNFGDDVEAWRTAVRSPMMPRMGWKEWSRKLF